MEASTLDAEEAADARALAIVGERNVLMHSEASIAHGRGFIVRPSDVFVATYPKCGTTWMTAIVHSLRTRGDDAHQLFEEITEVAPWDIVARDCGQDLDAEQPGDFRLFKSHESWPDVAKWAAVSPSSSLPSSPSSSSSARYVYVVRHPSDAFVSFYEFLPQYMHAEGLRVETFATAIFGGLSQAGGIWTHFVDWFEAARARPEAVLVVSFEDLKADLPGEIARVANFLKLDASPELLRAVTDKSTHAYMSQHGTQFDDHFVFERLKRQMGMASDATHKASKVRKGAVGSRDKLPQNVADMLEKRWHDTVERRLGFASYDDFRAAINQLNDQHHPA